MGCCCLILPTGRGHQAKSSGIKMPLCEEGPQTKSRAGLWACERGRNGTQAPSNKDRAPRSIGGAGTLGGGPVCGERSLGRSCPELASEPSDAAGGKSQPGLPRGPDLPLLDLRAPRRGENTRARQPL
uniref:Uncharacterized protein n=1 Tax=Mustela putorius furo TaxID=9669 RepID=M3YIS2_MUSPF